MSSVNFIFAKFFPIHDHDSPAFWFCCRVLPLGSPDVPLFLRVSETYHICPLGTRIKSFYVFLLFWVYCWLFIISSLVFYCIFRGFGCNPLGWYHGRVFFPLSLKNVLIVYTILPLSSLKGFWPGCSFLPCFLSTLPW